MIPLLTEKNSKLIDACRRFEVSRLEVFGCAADATAGSFDPQCGDVDLLVEFNPGVEMGPWLRRYFDLRDELSRLLGKDVDLVMFSALQHPRSPHFAREVNRTRRLLYAA